MDFQYFKSDNRSKPPQFLNMESHVIPNHRLINIGTQASKKKLKIRKPFESLAASIDDSVARNAINSGMTGRQRGNTLDAFKNEDLESNYTNLNRSLTTK